MKFLLSSLISSAGAGRHSRQRGQTARHSKSVRSVLLQWRSGAACHFLCIFVCYYLFFCASCVFSYFINL